jgi:hypothetical protein
VTLSNGETYYLSEANGWTVTVSGLPKYVNGAEAHYTWSEQSVLGYTQTSAVTNGTTTTFTNRFTSPVLPDNENPGKPPVYIFEDYDTPLGIEVIINHVGDCFD